MKPHQLICLLPVVMTCLVGCKPRSSSSAPGRDDGISENIDQAEQETAAKLKAVTDPVRQF